MTLASRICCAAFLVFLMASNSSAQSIGFWHLPSTQPQYCGLGVGPGHHVPMIRTHGCHPPRVSRCVHTRGCLSGGLANYGTFCGDCESFNCHAELDALISPESDVVAPEKAEHLFSAPGEHDQQVLPTPQVAPLTLPQN